MDFSRLISTLFRDKPGVFYENPAPPSDNFETNFESIFFTYPRPQSVPGVNYIKIDRTLIHKSILGSPNKEQKPAESVRGDKTEKDNENIESPKADKIVELNAEVSLNKNATENKIDESKVLKENLTQNGALERAKIKFVISRKKSVFSLKKKEEKQKNLPIEKKKNVFESDNSKNGEKKMPLVTKSSALQSISRSYSMSDSDSDNSEKHKTKSSSYQAKSHSTKYSQYRRKCSKNNTSCIDAIPYDKVGLRSAEFSIKKEVVSSDEESLSLSFSKKAEITVQEKVLSDKDNHQKDKIKSSKSNKKKYDDLRNCDESKKRFDDSQSHDDSRSCEDSRKRCNDRNHNESPRHEADRNHNEPQSFDCTKNSDDSHSREDARDFNDTCIHHDAKSNADIRNLNNSESDNDARSLNDSQSCEVVRSLNSSQIHEGIKSCDGEKNNDDSSNHNDTKNHENSRKHQSDHSSDDDSKNRPNEDLNKSNKSLIPPMEREIKQESGTGSCLGPNDFYCDICKLILNSETTFSSHMAGKRHKKAIRQLSEQEVAKSSVLEITESQHFPRPPDVDRIELYDEDSKIQSTCEDAALLIVGLDHVREIRGYEDTKYFCDLCGAQCVANSIVKHLIGFKHQMNCLKEYCARSYSWVKDLDKRDKRVERELRLQLEDAIRVYGKGRIRVFRDVKRNQRSSDPYYPYQPCSSRPVLLPGDVQGKNMGKLTVTDEDCLSRDFSDFYCKVCDSHMNNYSMWESHARGKRHANNKKKASAGLVTNSNFVEAPRGAISHLEDMIYEQCGPDDIIVGMNFIRENQGENGDLYNCYLCGSVCPSIDIVDHLYLKKHKIKYLEKMLSDGYYNAINEISSLAIGETAREGLIDDECEKMMREFGHGKPVICVTKKIF